MRNSSDSKLQKALLRKHRVHAGLYVRVARRLGLHQSYVSKVAHGKLSAPKISRALLEELRRIEHIRRTGILVSLSRRSRSDGDQGVLRKHCLHLGLYARVAQQVGVDMSYVSLVAAGKRTSSKISRALNKELRRIERR
jgi:DNA-binding transcriptional regulator YdaS (Cro superfamily)